MVGNDNQRWWDVSAQLVVYIDATAQRDPINSMVPTGKRAGNPEFGRE
ncbi:hypothetical protein A2U01_0015175, partial [Trifolium medium]|nr:hypothetical protein [Trifolium medium]